MLSSLGKLLTARFLTKPIFLVGGSRSGTIVLLKAIGQHPDILATPSENPFITHLGRLAYDLTHDKSSARSYYDRSVRLTQHQIEDALRRLAIETSLGPDYGLRYLASESWTQRTLLSQKRFWCTKSFPGKNTALGLRVLYPDCPFIWIRRNGLNVIFSRSKFPEFRDLDFTEHCHHWANSIKRFAYLAELPNAVAIRHEDLRDEPETVFRRIFALIGVPDHPASAEFARNTHVHPLDNLSTTSGVNVVQVLANRPPPYESWTPNQRFTFKDICGDAMEIAGYEIPF